MLASIGPLSRPIGPPSTETLPVPTTIVRLSLNMDPTQVPWSAFRDTRFWGAGEDFGCVAGAGEFSLEILGLLARFCLGALAGGTMELAGALPRSAPVPDGCR